MKKLNKKLNKQVRDRWKEVGVTPCEVLPVMIHGFVEQGWVLVVDNRRSPKRFVGACPPYALPQYWAFMQMFSQGA